LCPIVNEKNKIKDILYAGNRAVKYVNSKTSLGVVLLVLDFLKLASSKGKNEVNCSNN
jgi:hypothetical protein